MVEILQCFGSNYFDKQGTEKGRGGEITIFQKVNGVTQRIANVVSPRVLNQGGFLTVGACVGCERRAARVA